MTDYGKVNFKGLEITLTQGAYPEYMSNSTEPNNWMVANGIDKNGNEYRVEFKLKEEYEDQQEEVDDLEILFDFENPTEVYSHKDNKYI